jgi:hypothetical protein
MNNPLSFWPTAYGWEVFYLLVAGVGFVSSIWGVIDAWIARRILKQSGVNGERSAQAFHNLFEEVSRFIALGVLTYGGLFVTMTAPPAAPQTVFVLNTVSTILALKAMQDNRFRYKIRHREWLGGSK